MSSVEDQCVDDCLAYNWQLMLGVEEGCLRDGTLVLDDQDKGEERVEMFKSHRWCG